MERAEATAQLLAAKEEKDLSFAEIAKSVGRHPVWTAAAIHGQAVMSAEEADKLVDLLGLPAAVSVALQRYPMRGSLDEAVPTDPLIYRLYEIVLVYGTAMKGVIHEEFGDGIMSAIDFDMDITRVPDPKGDRVSITMTGKFLPYRKW
ncbi:MAG: cyanase [Streptosporangiales bacterium]|nr:cyanase [Streptosporangiales bacterium]